MTKRRYKRPASPAEIAIIRKERAEREADLARLRAQPDMIVVTDAASRIVHARRETVFERLHGRGVLSRDELRATHDLQDDLAAAEGASRGAAMERVDGSRSGDDGRLMAVWRLSILRSACGERSWWLLHELIQPAVTPKCGPEHWRHIVARITKIERAEVQTDRVRTACADLLAAYAHLAGVKRKSVAA
jgi:hypothetical protein